MSLKVIPVVLACDNHYVAHLAVVIASTLAVGHKDNVYDFYVLDGGIHESNQQILQTFLKKHTNARLTFLDVRSSFTDVILTTLPLATFLRLTLPEALTGLDKIVYLDTDLIVMKDVGVLYAEDMHDYYIAAVADEEIGHFIQQKSNTHLDTTIYRDKGWGAYATEFLGLETTNPSYFNAGVAVYNLALMRQDKIGPRMMAFLAAHQPLALCDQDVLNAVLKDRKKLLDPRWNVKPSPFVPWRKNLGGKAPFIIHYRLWAYGVAYASRYWFYLAQTPFVGTIKKTWQSYPFLFQPYCALIKIKKNLKSLLVARV